MKGEGEGAGLKWGHQVGMHLKSHSQPSGSSKPTCRSEEPHVGQKWPALAQLLAVGHP